MCRFQLITILVVSELINYFVICKKSNVQDSIEEKLEQEYLSKLFGAISRAKENMSSRRRTNDQIKHFYNTLSNAGDVEQYKKWLRQKSTKWNDEAFSNENDELAGLVEKELLDALSQKSSALLAKPYVQKKGRNDFLVIRADSSDPFVTVVPNDIYYNVEKKCVNWLDDCNQRGLRDRLLQKLHGPYK